MIKVPFNRPTLAGNELKYIHEALERGHLSGHGHFTVKCQRFLEENLGGGRALLTHSCTAALEMSALLCELGPGDEVIMPSWTFSSTANAFALRGAVPVFVDVRPDTLNIDEELIPPAITPRTKAICVVHYAGVGAEMDAIMMIANHHGLKVIEDAAQGLFAKYKGKPLGTFGHFSAFSFHETKNIISGEGGALVVNDPSAFARSEIIWEKGTNRAQFKRAEVARYTWLDIGSSYLPSDIIAAFLYAQLERGQGGTSQRVAQWRRYHDLLSGLESERLLSRPVVPNTSQSNGHIYYALLGNPDRRDAILQNLWADGMAAIIHYIPLHSSPAGLRFGRTAGAMTHTNDIASRLIRLPLHPQLTAEHQEYAVSRLARELREGR